MQPFSAVIWEALINPSFMEGREKKLRSIEQSVFGESLGNLCITQPKAYLFYHVWFVPAWAGRATQDCHSFIFPAQMLPKEWLRAHATTSYLPNPVKSHPAAGKCPTFPSLGTLFFVCWLVCFKAPLHSWPLEKIKTRCRSGVLAKVFPKCKLHSSKTVHLLV